MSENSDKFVECVKRADKENARVFFKEVLKDKLVERIEKNSKK